MRRITPALVLLALCGAAAGAQRFDSGTSRVSLLELYTSEGCSSCPPADDWLSGLQRREDLWSGLVPVAFHVDYWNGLGWKDRFSDPRFSQRQRAYAARWRRRGVYTPAFVLNGREWWPGRQFGRRLKLTDAEAPGRLRATVSGERVSIRYRPVHASNRPLTAHVAVLGFGRETRVGAGENRGGVLRHDFVALAYRHTALTVDRHGALTGGTTLPGDTAAIGRVALAVWVSPNNSPVPLQATGGPLQFRAAREGGAASP